MTIFLTGATGYIGSYVAHGLLNEHGQKLALLVRAKNKEEGAKRLWQSLQLHMDFATFYEHLNAAHRHLPRRPHRQATSASTTRAYKKLVARHDQHHPLRGLAQSQVATRPAST